jgi:pimeloyl-ACP methyl ester carboxylesterase
VFSFLKNRAFILGIAAGGAGVLAARRVAYAPPDPALEARVHAEAYSGPWTHHYADVNGVRLHYADMGHGPLLVLLHGFPECWYTWHNVMPRLAARFRVIAPDMRGYNWSDKPRGVAAYRTAEVARDIAALIEHLGETRAFVAGHDWGGAVAWRLANDMPERVERLCIINAPHPVTYAREARKPEQFGRSLYALFFQLPLLPEAAVRLGIRRLGESASIPGAFSDAALDIYQNGVSQPGAATSMLNYYRAALRHSRSEVSAATRPTPVPTLVIWGMKDFALSPRLLDGLEEWVPDLRIERVEESGHWVPEEKPRVVSDLLADFFS